jgi:hypothetical protein
MIDNSTCPQVRFERELVVGSVGTLWLGRLTAGTEAGRIVMLRRIPKDLLTPKDVGALVKIGEAYGKVRHPSLVKLLGVVEQDQDVICVSEHLDGVRLHDLLRNAMDRDAPLPATVAVRIVLDAARATTKAHRLAAEVGLFPSARLFVPDGVFVASFGGTLLTEVGVLGAIARTEQPRRFPDLITQLAPEEFHKAVPPNGSPEVFSLGVLLWEGLANRPLFSRDSQRTALQDLSNLPIPGLNCVERCGMPVPDSLAEVVRVATLRRPNQRYASVDAFAAALEQLPAHFIATEHQVASALREQAGDLVQQFHVDPSQSSLTLAFSRVHSGRMSTCPPPSDSQRWEAPTFAQSRLVSLPNVAPVFPDFDTPSVPEVAPTTTTQASESPAPLLTRIQSSVPAPLGLEVAAPASDPHERHTVSPTQRSRVFWRIAWSAVALLMLAALAAFASRTSVTRSHWKPPTTSGQVHAQPSRTDPHIAHAQQPESDMLAPAALPNPTTTTQLVPETSTARGATSVEAVGASTASKTKPSGSANASGVYRPRQISPYRPKGI